MGDSRTECELLVEISRKLDRLIGLVAIAGRDPTDQIALLRGLGFEWGDIGLMVGLKPDAARKRLETLVKDGRKKPGGSVTKLKGLTR